MLNNITVMGRLTRDPEVRTTQTGTTVASFTLAVERDFKDQSGQRPVDFLDVVTWKGTADLASKFLSKGRQIVVIGRLETRKWQDKNGNNRTSYEIICNSFYFADSGGQQGQQQGYAQQNVPQSGYTSQQSYQQPQQGYATQQPSKPQQQSFSRFGTQVPFDEEVPF